MLSRKLLAAVVAVVVAVVAGAVTVGVMAAWSSWSDQQAADQVAAVVADFRAATTAPTAPTTTPPTTTPPTTTTPPPTHGPNGEIAVINTGWGLFPIWEGTTTKVLDRGGGGLWEQSAPLTNPTATNRAIGCHRTTHGAPCRPITGTQIGDTWTIEHPSGTSDTWTVVDVVIVSETAVELLDPFNTVDGQPTLRLFSCSRADGTAGGITHRVVATATRTGD